MSFDPEETYVLLHADGAASLMPGGEAFWRLTEPVAAQSGISWLVSEYFFECDWPSWEMHPHADEFVYLLSGEAVLHLQLADGVQVVNLAGRGAVIIPCGSWHTAKISSPSRMLHITRGAGTQIRPVKA